ncbi:MAG: GspH/FimT family pseudopilin [Acetobacteraceae bacterium]
MRGTPGDQEVTRCSSGGFTMIELLVVIAIIGMTMTIAPAIMAGMTGSNLRAATNELVARLRETRAQAIRRGAPTEVVFDTAGLSYTTSFAPGVRALPRVVSAIDLLPKGTDRIRFYPDGTASDATIALRHGDSSQFIAIDWLTGRVRHGE